MNLGVRDKLRNFLDSSGYDLRSPMQSAVAHTLYPAQPLMKWESRSKPPPPCCPSASLSGAVALQFFPAGPSPRLLPSLALHRRRAVVSPGAQPCPAREPSLPYRYLSPACRGATALHPPAPLPLTLSIARNHCHRRCFPPMSLPPLSGKEVAPLFFPWR